jgi:hypothetical protein
MYDSYKLPIVQIDSWDDLIDISFIDYLESEYYNGKMFSNMEELKMDFWFKKIIETKKIILNGT